MNIYIYIIQIGVGLPIVCTVTCSALWKLYFNILQYN